MSHLRALLALLVVAAAIAPASAVATTARTPSDVEAARAVERYYSSYDVEALPSAAAPAGADTGDGIAPLPFALALAGALVVGLAAGSVLPALVARRHRVGMAG